MSKAGIVHLNVERLVDRAMHAEIEGAPQNMSLSCSGELEPRREYMGASVIAQQCPRALWYQFRWWARDLFPARIMRRFETGNTYEERVVRWLRLAGFEIRDKNPRARNDKKQYRGELSAGLLAGHLDGFIRHEHLLPDWAELEIKAMVSAKYSYRDGTPIGNRTDFREYSKGGHNLEGSWWRLKRLGLKEHKPEHYGQMQTYMGLSHEPIRGGKKKHFEAWDLDKPLTRGLYIAVNTDTDQIYDELIEYEPNWFRAARSRAHQLAHADTPPERVSENPAGFPCEWCDFVNHCHGNVPPERNCRTCKHSKLYVPGDPGYYSTQLNWVCTKHGRSCGDYEPCDVYEAIEDEEMF